MKNIFNEITNKVITGKWIESVNKGNGSCGLTLEKILNIQKNNFEVPDYCGIELKTKYSKKESKITLFHATPDSYLFEIKRLVNTYGYINPNENFKRFAIKLNTKRIKRMGEYIFTIKVNKIKKSIILKIYNTNFDLIDENISWSFDLLKSKLERKLSYLAFFHADRYYELQKVYFKYKDVCFFKLKSFDDFIDLINKGYIDITFSISCYVGNYRTGMIYDHGTSFSINEVDLNKLFIPISTFSLGQKK